MLHASPRRQLLICAVFALAGVALLVFLGQLGGIALIVFALALARPLVGVRSSPADAREPQG
jgi:hypothetical protein